jgi:hypothetical protein
MSLILLIIYRLKLKLYSFSINKKIAALRAAIFIYHTSDLSEEFRSVIFDIGIITDSLVS